jgi:hypothetical protein
MIDHRYKQRGLGPVNGSQVPENFLEVLGF